jgi:aspartyl-tRNA(Asn)/glutamyl-tRNA(Gln) amidotransferase subunit A
MSAGEISRGVAGKSFSAVEIAKFHINAIKAADKEIGAFLTVCDDEALAQARAIDRKISEGRPVGKLAGVPVAIKDNICTDGIRTTCASKALEDFIPPYNATVVEKLLAEDVVIVGKTNMDEFAMGSSTERSAFKITRNPRDLARVPGGSSGGSAAAVAAEMVPVALGSDTGGSIRQPAAFCGVVGLKPTYGLVSRYGLICLATSMDQVGPITGTVEDCALALEVIHGVDKRDSTSYRGDYPKDYLSGIDQGVRGMKICVPEELFADGLDKDIEASMNESIRRFERLGAEVDWVSFPIDDDSLSAYCVLVCSEASSNMAKFDGICFGYRAKDYDSTDELIEKSRSEAFGHAVKREIILGTWFLSSGNYDRYFIRAVKYREALKKRFEELFSRYDLVLGPTSPVLPFGIGELKDDPHEMISMDRYTAPVNLAGLPAISIPCGASDTGLPIGMQLIGPHFGERAILQAAYAFEQDMRKEVI